MLFLILFELILPLAFSKESLDHSQSKISPMMNLNAKKNSYKNDGLLLKEEQNCPDDIDGYEKFEDGPIPDAEKVFACGSESISTRLEVTKSILRIYYCKFSASYSGSAISINIQTSIASNDPIEIYYCSFSHLMAGCIEIHSNDLSRSFDIYNCTFLDNQVNKGTDSIIFNAPKGKIQKCHFSDCLTNENGGNIEYIYKQSSQYTDGLIITQNTFYKELPMGIVVYFRCNSNSKVEFTNNRFNVADDMGLPYYLIDCEEGSTFESCTFSGNCLTQMISDSVIKSPNAANVPITFEECGPEEEIDCPEDPEGYEDSTIYTYMCGDSFEESPGISADGTILAIFYTKFTGIKENKEIANDAIIHVKTRSDMSHLKDQMKLIGCTFTSNSFWESSLIYIESVESISRLFEIKDCTFTENQGGITIKANNACFEFNHCTFTQSTCQPSTITYEKMASSTSSKVLLAGEEPKYLLNFYDCTFDISNTNNNGGAISISINSEEPSKPIIINGCHFKRCTAGGGDIDKEKGGAIYYSFTPPATTISSSKKLLADEENFALKIVGCEFSENIVSCYGGSIYISVANKELSKPIEINGCAFNDGTADNSKASEEADKEIGSGADIYYESSYASTSTEKALLITGCKFIKGNAIDKGGSLYLAVTGDSSKIIEINDCTFNDCLSTNGNAIDIVSNQPNAKFNIIGSHFLYRSAINFNAINGLVQKCDFADIMKPLRYECNSESTEASSSSFTIDQCTFTQPKIKDTTALLFLVPKASSKFIFTGNTVTLSTDEVETVTVLIDSNANLPEIVPGSWTFSPGNTLLPAKKNRIKTENAKNIPVQCTDFGFECPPNCEHNTRCETDIEKDPELPTVDISESQFTDITIAGNGGAICLTNVGLTGHDSTFTRCKSTVEGFAGGGIYININTHIDYEVSIKKIEFSECQATYGGAIYVYCNDEAQKISINACTFISNIASTKPAEGASDSNLFGGSAIFMTVKKSVIVRCTFKKNSVIGVKMYNIFPSSDLRLLNNGNDDGVSIKDCTFEVDEKSLSSLFYVRSANELNDVQTNIENCIFKGDLAEIAHHIDGTPVESAKSSKFVVKSCKFDAGLEKAFNVNVASFDVNSLEFNINEKKKLHGIAKWNVPLVPLMIGVGIISIGALISAIIIILKKKKDANKKEDEEEQERNATLL